MEGWERERERGMFLDPVLLNVLDGVRVFLLAPGCACVLIPSRGKVVR